MVNAFEDNKAETLTMLPTIKAFMAAHRLSDVVIVADAGMISENNMKQIEAEGLSFILGMRIPEVPYVVADWRKYHPDTEIPDGRVFIQPRPAGPTDKRNVIDWDDIAAREALVGSRAGRALVISTVGTCDSGSLSATNRRT
jgi:hypothetical protein